MLNLKTKMDHFTKILRWFIAYYPQRHSKIFSRVILKKIEQSGDQLSFSGTLFTNSKAENGKLIIRKFRDEEISASTPVSLTPIKTFSRLILLCLKPITNINSYNFLITTNIDWDELSASIYVISIDFNGTSSRMFLKSDTSITFHLNDGKHTLHIFEEPVISSIRLELYKFGSEDFKKIKSYQPNHTECNCIISEYTNSARDNGLALYNYISRNTEMIRPIYVIEKDNIDNFYPDGKTIVEFGSIEHLKACINSKIAAFTHHRTYCYPHILRDININRYDNVYTIFLQHGVTALKKMVVKHYKKERCKYSSVVVCSQKEAEIFHEHMNFPMNEIHITGFSRHDHLYDLVQQRETENCILVFPTWRTGLEKKESSAAQQTEFIQKWQEALLKLKTIYDGEIVLILHPIIHRHANLFEGTVDRVAQASNFQEELINAQCLITDYSSVCFDALYSKKPVILFQFDREEYGFEKDTFIDIQSELPGLFAKNADEVVREFERLKSSGWDNRFKTLRDLYFQWDDNENSKRILEIIKVKASE